MKVQVMFKMGPPEASRWREQEDYTCNPTLTNSLVYLASTTHTLCL